MRAREYMQVVRPVTILVALGIAYAAYFYLFPDTDLRIHAALYHSDTGFYLGQENWVRFFYKLIPVINKIIVFSGLFLLALNFWKKKKHFLTNRQILFVLLSLAIGPGLLVNTLFKDQFGRARPSQIVEFGGTKKFTPPLIVTDQCEKNCSFVSGHASSGFFMAAFAMLLTGWKRRAAYVAALAFGLWIGFIRMAMGGHFFSDVLFAGIFTLIVIHLIYYWLLVRHHDHHSRRSD